MDNSDKRTGSERFVGMTDKESDPDIAAEIAKLIKERDEARREICENFGRRWAYPIYTYSPNYEYAKTQGIKIIAKDRGWDYLYEW